MAFVHTFFYKRITMTIRTMLQQYNVLQILTCKRKNSQFRSQMSQRNHIYVWPSSVHCQVAVRCHRCSLGRPGRPRSQWPQAISRRIFDWLPDITRLRTPSSAVAMRFTVFSVIEPEMLISGQAPPERRRTTAVQTLQKQA